MYLETWKFILHFFYVITNNQKANKGALSTISSLFSDILFKPNEYGSNDMALWKNFTELLLLMIKKHHEIFDNP